MTQKEYTNIKETMELIRARIVTDMCNNSIGSAEASNTINILLQTHEKLIWLSREYGMEEEKNV